MSHVLRLTDGNFEEEVSQSRIPVLVEFCGSWCVPSQQMKPMLETIAREYDGKVKIGDLNVDQNPRTAAQYQIMGCPTFILLSSGKPISRRVGAQSKKQLLEMIPSAVK
jgi:thioredoxin 1